MEVPQMDDNGDTSRTMKIMVWGANEKWQLGISNKEKEIIVPE